jgi:carbohydrate-binding DOMON domain-containing protein
VCEYVSVGEWLETQTETQPQTQTQTQTETEGEMQTKLTKDPPMRTWSPSLHICISVYVYVLVCMY